MRPLTAMSGRIINDPCLMARLEMLRVATSVRWKRWSSTWCFSGARIWGAVHHPRRSGMSAQLTTKTTEVLKPQKNRILRNEKVKLAPHTRCRFSFADLSPLWMWSLARQPWWHPGINAWKGWALRAVQGSDATWEGSAEGPLEPLFLRASEQKIRSSKFPKCRDLIFFI